MTPALFSRLLIAGAVSAWSCTPSGPKSVVSEDEPPPAVADAVVVSKSPTPAPEPPLEPAPAPDPAPPPAPSRDSSEDSPERVPELARLVDDLAIAMTGRSGKTNLYVTDAQVFAGAEWAGSDDLETPRLRAGETLHGLCPDGVADWRVEIGRHVVHLVREGERPSPGLCLMTKTHRPSPRARLAARPLARVAGDGDALRKSVADELRTKMKPVGEVKGVFGGGIDRVVVFTPSQEIDLRDSVPHGDVALLVAGETPRGLLPFADYDKEPEGVSIDLQVAGVFDIDGDGVEEILWLNEDAVMDGSGPLLQVSYFAREEHRVRVVMRKSYGTVRELGGQARR